MLAMQADERKGQEGYAWVMNDKGIVAIIWSTIQLYACEQVVEHKTFEQRMRMHVIRDSCMSFVNHVCHSFFPFVTHSYSGRKTPLQCNPRVNDSCNTVRSIYVYHTCVDPEKPLTEKLWIKMIPTTGSSREIETTVFDPASQFLSNISRRA